MALLKRSQNKSEHVTSNEEAKKTGALLEDDALEQVSGGANGMKGMNGMNGMKGMNGMNGMKGMNGMNGMNGMKGMNGMNGTGTSGIGDDNNVGLMNLHD